MDEFLASSQTLSPKGAGYPLSDIYDELQECRTKEHRLAHYLLIPALSNRV